MFDYMKLLKLIPMMCDRSMYRFVSTNRLPVNVEKYLEDENITITGSIDFYKDDIRIYLIYGESKYAMMHEVIDDKYTFCLFPDYILDNDNRPMEVYHMIHDSIYLILSYTYPILTHNKAKQSYIKDTFVNSMVSRMKYIAAYNVWTLLGERFLDDYTDVNPEDVDIDKVIEMYDNFVKSGAV